MSSKVIGLFAAAPPCPKLNDAGAITAVNITKNINLRLCIEILSEAKKQSVVREEKVYTALRQLTRAPAPKYPIQVKNGRLGTCPGEGLRFFCMQN